MPANVKIEKVEAAEAQVTAMNAEEDRMRKIYMRDGVIDDTEQDALDRIKGKIVKLETVIARLRAEIEENKRIWESRSGDYTRIQEQLRDLKAFAHPDTATMDGEIKVIGQAETDQRWADATAALDQAQYSMEPVWEDYERQTAARDEYDPLRTDFDVRLAAAAIAEPQTVVIAQFVSDLRAKVPTIDAAVVARDYVTALDLLKTAVGQLELAEAEIVRVQAAKAAYDAALAALMPRLMDASVSEFSTFLETQTELVAIQTAMEDAATIHDYETASNTLTDLETKVAAFLLARDALAALRDTYVSGLAAMKSRLAAASSSELSTTATLQQAIIDAEDAMTTEAEAENFEEAIRLQGNLDTALQAYEAVIEDRDLYLARVAAMSDELLEASVSQPKWLYLSTIQTEMAGLQSEMEAAAEAEDFATALLRISDLEAKLVEFYDAIAAKKVEYETARALLDVRLLHLDECKYYVPTERSALEAAVKAIEAPVTDEDWSGAIDRVKDADTAMDAFDTAHAAWDAALRAAYATDMVDVRKALKDYATSTASTKASLVNLVAGIDKALAGTDDIDEVQSDVLLAQEMAKDLAVVAGIMERLEKSGFLGGDDEARAIVKEMKPADLVDLPQEARNRLVDELMNGYVTDDDHDAIQSIWASPSIDARFEEMDSKARDHIMKTFRDDPKVQQYANDWATMSESDKKAAVRHLASIPCSEEGWGIDPPKDINVEAEHFTGDKSSYRGYFSSSEDALYLNVNNPDMANFTQVLMTATHEIGHKYQNSLIDRLDNDDADDPIRPGDPEYEEARALKLNKDYRNNHTDDWKDMVHQRDGAPFYSGTPEETHSRATANDIRSGLGGKYGPSDEQHL